MPKISDWGTIQSPELFQRLFFDEALIYASEHQRGPIAPLLAQSPAPYAGKVIVLLPESPTDSQQSLLNKILSACALSQNQIETSYGIQTKDSIRTFAGARLVLAFGALSDIEPNHMEQQHDIKFIPCQPLGSLETDASAKKLLWNSLKKSLLA